MKDISEIGQELFLELFKKEVLEKMYIGYVQDTDTSISITRRVMNVTGPVYSVPTLGNPITKPLYVPSIKKPQSFIYRIPIYNVHTPYLYPIGCNSEAQASLMMDASEADIVNDLLKYTTSEINTELKDIECCCYTRHCTTTYIQTTERKYVEKLYKTLIGKIQGVIYNQKGLGGYFGKDITIITCKKYTFHLFKNNNEIYLMIFSNGKEVEQIDDLTKIIFDEELFNYFMTVIKTKLTMYGWW